MKPKSVLSPIAISLGLVSINVAAEELHDWSGLYAGGMIGYSNTKTTAKGDGSVFRGDVYESVNSMSFDNTDFSNISRNFNLSALSNHSSSQDTNAQGTLLIGVNKQNDHIVFGGEFRASFGDFGASTSSAGQSSGSVTGHDFEGSGNTFILTNHNNVLSGYTSPISLNDNWPDFSASYQQQISQKNEIKFNNVEALIGRLGWAEGSLLWYVLAGVNYASVKANTRATIVESAVGVLNDDPTTYNFSGSKTYLFSGQHTKGMLGYTLGAGLDWAIDDKLTLRIEGEYHDLGSISVTGTSTQTLASYKVKQEITGYSLATGLIYRF